jgi:hypothetical protein
MLERHASRTLLIEGIDRLASVDGRQRLREALLRLPVPIEEAQRHETLHLIGAATERAGSLRRAVMQIVDRPGWADSPQRLVLADWLIEVGDPWGEVVAAQVRGVSPDEALYARHRLRWSMPLGAGIAHERTEFVAGLPAIVTVESLAKLTQTPPSEAWATVREVHIPFGYHEGSLVPDVGRADDVARFFASLSLERVTGAQWVAPALQQAVKPVRIESLRFGSLPPLDFQAIGLRAVKRLVATDAQLPALHALTTSARGSALETCEVSASGRMRATLWPAEGRLRLEAVAPHAREGLERLATEARRQGWRDVVVHGKSHS